MIKSNCGLSEHDQRSMLVALVIMIKSTATLTASQTIQNPTLIDSASVQKLIRLLAADLKQKSTSLYKTDEFWIEKIIDM